MTIEKENSASLTSGSIKAILVRLTIPMLFGIVGMVVFNLVDTIYIGQLGTIELAALSFTFPVVMVVTSLGLGIGTGASSLISHAIGVGDLHKVQRLTSDSLVLSMFLVLLFIGVGYFTIDPLFTALGATPEILIHIRSYMEVWYLGVPFVIVPMVGNNALRARGDMRTPAAIMLIIVVVNIILDPFLIFGIGPFPALGLRGAAIATVIARAISLVISLYFLHFRDNMLTFETPSLAEVVASWRSLLSIALPAAGSKMIVPVAIGVITRMIARFGPAPVAAFGAASKVEFLVLAIVMALSSVLNPFVGQNIGAGQLPRARQALKMGQRFALLWGAGSFVFMIIMGRYIAPLFSEDQEVVNYIALYLAILSISFGLRGVFDISVSVLNVLRRPLHAGLLVLMLMFILLIPLAYAGAGLFGVKGIFWASSVANVAAGLIAYLVLWQQFGEFTKLNK
jgi:putative MATE family efflux protein